MLAIYFQLDFFQKVTKNHLVMVPVDLDRGVVVLDCLRPDWDTLIEIQSALRCLPHVCLQYVEEHQDKKRLYHCLDLLGQLNVDADNHAGM
jgi:hypothetical protein